MNSTLNNSIDQTGGCEMLLAESEHELRDYAVHSERALASKSERRKELERKVEKLAERYAEADSQYKESLEALRRSAEKLSTSLIKACDFILVKAKESGPVDTTDGFVRQIVSACTRSIKWLITTGLDIQSEAADSEDDEVRQHAEIHLLGARRVAEAVNDVVLKWPWTDPDQVAAAYEDIAAGRTKDVSEIIAELQD